MMSGLCRCCLTVITGLTCNRFHTALMLFLLLESFARPNALLQKVPDRVLLFAKQIEFLSLSPDCSETAREKRTFLL